MKQVLYFFCFFFCLSFLAAGQPSQIARTELLLNNDYREFFVWPQPDSSVLVLKLEKPFRRTAEPFTLFKYNQDLVLNWQHALGVPRNSQFLYSTTQDNICYLIFEGDKSDELILAQVNTKTAKQTLTKYFLPESMTFKVTGVEALNGYLYLRGLQNGRVAVLHLNPRKGLLLKVPAVYDQSSALTEFLADTISNRLEVILAESNGLKGRLQVKRLAPDGRLFTVNFLQHRDYNYINGRLSPGDSAGKLLTGTYSLRDLRYAQGFFAGKLGFNNEHAIQYYDFTTFSHYFDYLKPGRQEKLRRKVARFRVTRKLFQLRHRMLMHRMYPFNSGYFLVAEMYFPHYHNEGMSRGIFDGYEFTEAVVAALDKEGNLRWENSYPLQDIRTFDLKENVTVGLVGDRAILCYLQDENIKYKEIQSGESTPNDKVFKTTTILPTERIQSTDPEGILFWYNNNFITFGEQNIRGATGLRIVFYLNKIAF